MALEPDHRVTDPKYYLREENQLRTEFKGNLSKILGIDGTFNEGAYDRLMRGMEPELVNGKEKKLTLRLDSDRVMADDWTFNYPKSVSLAALVGGDTRIPEIASRAEDAAMKFIESQATVKVRKKSELAVLTESKTSRRSDNLLYIRFRHPGSREGDPHFHTHYVILNLSFDKEERNTKAVCLKHIDRKAAADIHRDVMRKGLHQLGYKTKVVGREYEIVGFPAEIKGKFSEGHQRVEQKQQEMEAKIGKPMGRKAKAKLSLYDRPEKDTNMPLEERRKGWLARMTDAESKGVFSTVNRAVASVKRSRLAKYLERTLTHAREQGIELERGNVQSR